MATVTNKVTKFVVIEEDAPTTITADIKDSIVTTSTEATIVLDLNNDIVVVTDPI